VPGLPPNNRLTQHGDNHGECANSITAKCGHDGETSALSKCRSSYQSRQQPQHADGSSGALGRGRRELPVHLVHVQCLHLPDEVGQ